MHPQYTPKDVARFWSRVDKSGDCWLWTGQRTRQGYGVFRVNGKRTPSHRVAYQIENGPITDSVLVRHRACNNPPCVNPAHLAPGSVLDNMHDRMEAGHYQYGDDHWSHKHPEHLARGDANGARLHPDHLARGQANGAYTHPERVPRGDRHASRIHPETYCRGETVWNAKLTEDKVREIRQLYADGKANQSQLGRQYGVHQAVIWNVVNRRTWKHVQ